MDSELHVLLFKLEIHQIRLSVRFPCSLSFSLRADNKSVDCQRSFELVKGDCEPLHTLATEVNAEKKDESGYREKNVKLVIMMVSQNGRIPAGTVTFNLAKLHLGKSETGIVSIEKCPDKSATLEHTVSIQFLKKNEMKKSDSQNSFYMKLDLDSSLKTSNKGQKSSTQIRPKNSGDKNSSSDYILKNSRGKYRTGKETPEREVKNLPKVEELSQNLTQRLANLEREKSMHMKEISQIRNQFHHQKSRDAFGNDELNTKMRHELNMMIAENEGLRQKNKLLERKEKQNIQVIKDLKEEIQRKKEKNHQQEFAKIEFQSLMDSKEKVLKDMQSHLKKYQQQISDLKINLNTQHKRVQFKQATYKEQMNKLTEKYQQSENERQKAIVQLNKMLEELESVEKKHQLNIKQRDRSQAEEKNKLLKKIETLSREIATEKQNNDDKDVQISDLERQLKQVHNKIKTSEDELSDLKNEYKHLSLNYGKEHEKRKNLEKVVEDLEESDKNLGSLRKKFSELQHKEATTKKSLEISQKNIHNLEGKLKSLEEQIHHKSIENNSLNSTITNLNNQIQAYKKEEDSLARETESLTTNNLSLAKKIQQLKGKLDQLQMGYQDLERTSQEQLNYLIKTKQHLEGQIQELKWNCEKIQEDFEESIKNIKSLNEEILELNKIILSKNEHITKLDEIIQDGKSEKKILEEERKLLQSKELQMNDRLKQKSEEVYSLTKKLNKVETEYFMAIEKSQHSEQYLTEKLQSQESASKAKESKINEANIEISRLQMQILEKENKINSLINDEKRMSYEIEYLKQQNSTFKKDQNDLEIDVQALKEKNKQLEDEIQIKNKQITDEKQRSSQFSKNSSKSSKELDQFRKATIAATQQLLQQIGKDTTSETTLLSFPDENLSSLQVEAIKRKNAILQKFKENITDLSSQLKIVEEEHEKLKDRSILREEQLENIITVEKNKFKNNFSEFTNEKKLLLENVNSLEENVHDLTSQCEHLNIEIKELKLNIEELESSLLSKTQQCEESDKQIRILSQTVKELQEEYQVAKRQYEVRMDSTQSEQTLQADKLKKINHESERKIHSLESVIESKDNEIEKLENKINELVYQRDNKEQMLQEINARHNDLILENKGKIENLKDIEKKLKKSEHKVTQIENERNLLSKTINQMEIQKKKVDEELAEVEKEKHEVCNELEICQERLKKFEETIKETGDKNKKTTEKHLQDITKLKEEAITLNSEIQLKTFLIAQLESTIKELKTASQDSGEEMVAKKNQIISLQAKIQQLNNQNILLNQTLDSAQTENQAFRGEISRLKEVLTELESQLTETQLEADLVELKDKQIAKLKEELKSKEKLTEKGFTDMKSQIAELNRDISSRVNKEEEYKKKIRQLQKNLEEQSYDIEAQRNNWEERWEKDKNDLLERLQNIQDENEQIIAEFDFQREQYKNQLEGAHDDFEKIQKNLHEKEMELERRNKSGSQAQSRIKELEAELKKCREDWENEKKSYVPTNKQFKELQGEVTRYQRYLTELEIKNQQLLLIGKKKVGEQGSTPFGQILRQISTMMMRNKAKIISKCPTEKDKELAMNQFKAIQDKIESAIRSTNALK